MRKLLITALFLSSIVGAEARDGTSEGSSGGGNPLPCTAACNPFSGAVGVGIVLEKNGFGKVHPKVPYWEYWGNEVNQTAQQTIAICSLFEHELGLSCFR